MAASEVATVRVSRLRAFSGSSIIWRVFIDGQQAVELGSGDSSEFAVHPGQHLLEVRPGWWAKGDGVWFSAGPGEMADFVIRPKTGGIRGGAVITPGPSSRVFGNPPPR